jgi:hypothetical protein
MVPVDWKWSVTMLAIYLRPCLFSFTVAASP